MNDEQKRCIEWASRKADQLGYQGMAETFRALLAASASAEPVASDSLPEYEQEWAKIEPSVAFHLIERHAENWEHAGKLMEAWRDATTATPRPIEAPDNLQDAPVSAFQVLKGALQADPDYAWSWHCNLAMPIMDSIRCTPTQANKAGADLMQYLFDIDIRKHPHWQHDPIDAARASSQIAGDKLVRPRIDEIGLTPQCPAMSMTNGAKND